MKPMNEQDTLNPQLVESYHQKVSNQKAISKEEFDNNVYPKFIEFLLKKNIKIIEKHEENEKMLNEITKQLKYSDIYDKRIKYRGDMDFLDRVNLFKQEKDKRLEKLIKRKKRKEKQNLKHYSFTPNIHRSNLQRNVEDLYDWKDKVEQKKEKLIKKKEKLIKKKKPRRKNFDSRKVICKSVHIDKRFHELNKPYRTKNKYIFNDDITNRLNGYKILYNKRKQKRIENSTKGLFKPQLISRSFYLRNKNEINKPKFSKKNRNKKSAMKRPSRS